MPDFSSMICTVPGAKVGSAGRGSGAGTAGDGSATVGVSPEPPKTSPAPIATTRASTESPTIHAVRWPPPSGAGSSIGGTGTSERGSGAVTGAERTTTPGPAGVATSDQVTPFHHRTRPGAPSGSG